MAQSLLAVTLALLVVACAQMPDIQQGDRRGQQIPTSVTNEAARDLAGLQAKVAAIEKELVLARASDSLVSKGPIEVVSRSPNVKLYVEPSQKSKAIATLKQGERFPLREAGPEWYAVEIPHRYPGAQPKAPAVGYIPAADANLFQQLSLFDPGGIYRKSKQQLDEAIDKAVKAVLDEAIELKKKWDTNPYMYVSSFSVSLGITNISVSLTFTFK